MDASIGRDVSNIAITRNSRNASSISRNASNSMNYREMPTAAKTLATAGSGTTDANNSKGVCNSRDVSNCRHASKSNDDISSRDASNAHVTRTPHHENIENF